MKKQIALLVLLYVCLGLQARLQAGCLEPDKKGLEYLSGRYERKGRLGNRQLMDYYLALKEAGKSEEAVRIYKELGSRMKKREKTDPHFWPYFADAVYGSDALGFLTGNAGLFIQKNGQETVGKAIYRIYLDEICRALSRGVIPEDLKNGVDGLPPVFGTVLRFSCRMAEVTLANDLDGYISLAEQMPGQMEEVGKHLVYRCFRMLHKEAGKAQAERLLPLLDKIIGPGCDPTAMSALKIYREDLECRTRPGTDFRDMSFDEAIHAAALLDKQLFIDCYTSWCGPCKWMVNKIFPKEQLGEFIDRKFLPVKFDMEKEEGMALKSKYDVKAYPTFLIVNPDGSLYHMTVGKATENEMVGILCISPSETSVALEARYRSGDRDKHFLKRYIAVLKDLYAENTLDVIDELSSSLTPEERFSDTYWFLYEDCLAEEKNGRMDFVLKHKDRFYRTIGKRRVDRYLAESILSPVRYIYRTSTDLKRLHSISCEMKSTFLQAKNELLRLDLASEKEYLAHFTIAEACLTGKVRPIADACHKVMGDLRAEDIPFAHLVSVNLPGLDKASLEVLLALGIYLQAETDDPQAEEEVSRAIQQIRTVLERD